MGYLHTYKGNEKHTIVQAGQFSASVNSDVVDTKGDIRKSFVISYFDGATGQTALDFKLRASDSSSSGFADVPASEIDGDITGITTEKESKAISYLGDKRYLRISLTATDRTGGQCDASVLYDGVIAHPTV